jgi:hypothetical protein
LWPFLEDRRPPARSARARDEILADLVRSNQSIMLNLDELKRRAEAEQVGSADGDTRRKTKPPADPVA